MGHARDGAVGVGHSVGGRGWRRAIGSGTGYGTGKDALIGTGLGAAAGAIYDIYNYNKD